MIGLLPIMWATGTGADLMKRIAAPMVGGLATSFLLELLVYPAVYFLWKRRELAKPPIRRTSSPFRREYPMTCPEATACCPHHAVTPTPLRKRHTLRFQPAEAARWTDACRRLTQLPGVTLATATAQGLEVEYDLLRITAADRDDLRCSRPAQQRWPAWLAAWLVGLYRKQRTAKHAAHPPHIACCNRPPDRLLLTPFPDQNGNGVSAGEILGKLTKMSFCSHVGDSLKGAN